MTEIIPSKYQEIKKSRVNYAEKVAQAVKVRLLEEIQYWDFRASELKMKEEAGKSNQKLNSDNAQRRADDLQARLEKRLSELEEEKTHQPPVPR